MGPACTATVDTLVPVADSVVEESPSADTRSSQSVPGQHDDFVAVQVPAASSGVAVAVRSIGVACSSQSLRSRVR